MTGRVSAGLAAGDGLHLRPGLAGAPPPRGRCSRCRPAATAAIFFPGFLLPPNSAVAAAAAALFRSLGLPPPSSKQFCPALTPMLVIGTAPLVLYPTPSRTCDISHWSGWGRLSFSRSILLIQSRNSTLARRVVKCRILEENWGAGSKGRGSHKS